MVSNNRNNQRFASQHANNHHHNQYQHDVAAMSDADQTEYDEYLSVVEDLQGGGSSSSSNHFNQQRQQQQPLSYTTHHGRATHYGTSGSHDKRRQHQHQHHHQHHDYNDDNDDVVSNSGSTGSGGASAMARLALIDPFEDVPTEVKEWVPVSINEYEHERQKALKIGEADRYCAICNDSSGQYPRLNSDDVSMLEDAIVAGMRHGRIEEAVNLVHYKYNEYIRTSINKSLELQEQAARDERDIRAGTGLYLAGDDEDSRESNEETDGSGSAANAQQPISQRQQRLPEWTRTSIRVHIMEHTNDPLMLVVRHAIAASNMGMGIYENNVVTKSALETGDDGSAPRFSFDSNAASKAVAIMEKSSGMLLKAIQLFNQVDQARNGTESHHDRGGIRKSNMGRGYLGKVVPTALPYRRRATRQQSSGF